MTYPFPMAVAGPLAPAARRGDWVLPISLDEPRRGLPSSVQWAERGPFRGFSEGLLFDRDAFAIDGKPDCSDAHLVLRAYERGGEAVLSRLRGSYVLAI